MANHPSYAVVIGASAGGFTALFDLVKGLRYDTDAAYFIVLHLSKTSIGKYLVSRIQDFTPLKCVLASDKLPIEKGQIYIAAPDYHLLVYKTEIRLGAGAAENRWRPSIDVLFRSAAVSFNTRCIGVVLTGLLNDGTTGMSAIKRCGGISIVQDPNEAEFPDMPLSVINNVQVDYCVPLSQIPEIIISRAGETIPDNIEPPEDIAADIEIMQELVTNIDTAEKYGKITPYTCPDCGGVLFLHNQDTISRFKCHTGHSFSASDLDLKQKEEFENSLWFAIRNLEQKKHLHQSLAERYTATGATRVSEDYLENVNNIDQHIQVLKQVLVDQGRLKDVD